MPDLVHSLTGYDLGHLRIVAELWGDELTVPTPRAGVFRLAELMKDRLLLEEMVDSLPIDSRAALVELVAHAGRQPWADFSRRYGTIREMGPGRRDRERPDLHPASIAETLFYRAFIARAFFDTPEGPREFAYLPDDLCAALKGLLPPPETVVEGEPSPILGRPAAPEERLLEYPVHDRVLDHATTFLAALRCALSLPWKTSPEPLWDIANPPGRNALRALLLAAGLLDAGGNPAPEPVRAFLEASRGEALAALARSWWDSSLFNDLALVPGLQLEGDWKNDPLKTRRTLTDLIFNLPSGKWWSLSAFISDVKETYPDFQRREGEYDTWYVREVKSGEYLRGIVHWMDVEGALLRFMITGPLHWLGFLDLAVAGENLPISAFRISKWAEDLIQGQPPAGMHAEEAKVHVWSDGRIHMTALVPRTARYQISRFCKWEVVALDREPGEYRYRLTPGSLARARGQGLRIDQLLALLRHSADGIPPNIPKALDRWEKLGPEVHIEKLSVIRLHDPKILPVLRKSRAARFLGDPIGPAAISVKPGAEEKVLAVLTELGYLGELAD